MPTLTPVVKHVPSVIPNFDSYELLRKLAGSEADIDKVSSRLTAIHACAHTYAITHLL